MKFGPPPERVATWTNGRIWRKDNLWDGPQLLWMVSRSCYLEITLSQTHSLRYHPPARGGGGGDLMDLTQERFTNSNTPRRQCHALIVNPDILRGPQLMCHASLPAHSSLAAPTSTSTTLFTSSTAASETAWNQRNSSPYTSTRMAFILIITAVSFSPTCCATSSINHHHSSMYMALFRANTEKDLLVAAYICVCLSTYVCMYVCMCVCMRVWIN